MCGKYWISYHTRSLVILSHEREFHPIIDYLCTQTQNLKTDSLTCSARKQSSFIVHMDTDHLFWFTESVWMYFFMTKNKSYSQPDFGFSVITVIY